MNRNPFANRLIRSAGVVLSLFAATAVAEPTVRVAKFADDRAAAISYTFDDNLRDQFTVAVPMLNEVGFKGTFFVIPGSTAETPEEGQKKDGQKRAWGGVSWPELKEMAAQGHEIASHTWSHPNLRNGPLEAVEAQFTKANDAILDRIGKPALTLAFPFNASTPEIEAIARKHYVAFRDRQTGTSGGSTVEKLNAWADKLVADESWGVLMVHGVATGYAAFSDAEIFRTHLKYVKAQEGIWVATFADVARYVRERDDAKVSFVAADGKGGTITLSGTLDPRRYDVPLTIVIDVPGATSARATRAGQPLPVRVQRESIHVAAAPSTQPISVAWE